MRSDEACLREMLDAADQILDLAAKPDAERLLNEDRVFRHSMFFEFVVLGEQISLLSGPLQTKYPEVPWRRIAAFRNRVAHGYFGLSLPIVWQICKEQIPELRRQLQTILSEEFSGGSEISQV
jgi:uncharacterized protein with HEPN domain